MIKSYLNTAIEAANLAASEILNSFNKPKNVEYKSRTDLVTDTDRNAERIITSVICSKFPNHGILAEESGLTERDKGHLWVIDPLDGTTNFVHGYPSFGISIGLLENNKPIIGVVVELPANNIYTAIKNEGAYCNDQKLAVSQISNLDKSLLVTGFGYQHGEKWQANIELFKQLTDKTQGVRRLGAAAIDLCHVAKGVVDGYWEFDLNPWDSAAGVLIVEEAGGKISGMNGDPHSIYDKHILASNGLLHADILRYTSKVSDKLF
ncbi:inositol monophosphatase family protein [Candidatus Neomarinimicrobiota bacterium]